MRNRAVLEELAPLRLPDNIESGSRGGYNLMDHVQEKLEQLEEHQALYASVLSASEANPKSIRTAYRIHGTERHHNHELIARYI